MRRVCALLRAVNVGGRQLAMAELKALLEAEGFEAPQTLLASGNAVFGTELAASAVEERLEAALQARFGFFSEVYVRDRAGLEAVIAANPFGDFARDQPSRLMAVFLKGEPPQDLSRLERLAVLGEQIARGPRCLYIAYPEGAGKSKVGVKEGTARNWNTVAKLAERLAGDAR